MDRLAELRSHATELEEKVTCPVCFEIYREPRLLVPCCHTLCGVCYAAMHSQGGGHFDCPLCRQKCEVAPSAARRNAAMEDLVSEAARVHAEIQRVEKSTVSGWPVRLTSQIQCQSEPWDLVLAQHRDSGLFLDHNHKRIFRADPLETSGMELPHDLLFCIGDDLEDVRVFALDGRLLVANWRLIWPDDRLSSANFYDIHRASFDRGNSRLVLSDFVRHRIIIADLAGAVEYVIELPSPTASCVQARVCRLFVVSSNGTRVSSFWTAENCRPTGVARGGFQRLADVACDELQVYATDSEARQVCVLNADSLVLLSAVTLNGQPQFLQLLPPGFLLAVVRSDSQATGGLVLMSTGNQTVVVQKELPCLAKISGLAYDATRDLLLLCDCQNWVINGFLAAPLTFLAF